MLATEIKNVDLSNASVYLNNCDNYIDNIKQHHVMSSGAVKATNSLSTSIASLSTVTHLLDATSKNDRKTIDDIRQDALTNLTRLAQELENCELNDRAKALGI